MSYNVGLISDAFYNWMIIFETYIIVFFFSQQLILGQKTVCEIGSRQWSLYADYYRPDEAVIEPTLLETPRYFPPENLSRIVVNFKKDIAGHVITHPAVIKVNPR